MKNFQKLVLLSILLFGNITTAAAASRVEYILDVSGSMKTLSGGERRIDAAKKAVASMVQGIPEGSIIALRLYAHRLPPTDKVASCKDTELVIPFGAIDKQRFLSIVYAATPLGQTPIAYSLEQASLDFTPGADEAQNIILVSDGEESCGGDPAAVARGLIAKGFKFKIHTIGFDVDAKTRAQLEGISLATGGQYMDARDAASLYNSLQKLTQESLVIQKSEAVYGDEVRGGDNYESAAPVTLGKLFRLNHHQRVNQFDYFYVDAKPGQKIIVTLETGEKGVDIRENQATENRSVYAGIQLHSPERAKIQSEELIGSPNAKKDITLPVALGKEGRYYILVGSTYADVHKDNRFKVELAELFDANSKQDAGANEATSLEVSIGNYEKNYLSPSDNVDMYKFNAAAGDYEIKGRDMSGKLNLRLTLTDSDGVQIAEVSSPNEGAVAKMERVTLKKPGYYFLRFDSNYTIYNEVPYLFSVTPIGAGALREGTSAGTQTTISSTSGQVGGASPAASEKEICSQFKRLPFFKKVKWIGLYSGVPLVVGWLVGMIWGYFKGKRRAKPII